MGAHDFKLNKVPFSSLKSVNINVSRSVFPETSSCASKLLLLRCKLVIPKCLCQVSLGLKEVQMGAHDFKLNKVPFFALKSVNINVSRFAAPKTSSCASKPLKLRCKCVKHECLCQVSLGFKGVRLRHMTSNLTRFLFCSKNR